MARAMKLQRLLRRESTTGIVLLLCALLSILVANSAIGGTYRQLWSRSVGGHPLSHWIDDGLMAVFFLLVGLELKRELLFGSLRSPKQALVPLLAAVGGMAVPAAVYLVFNWGVSTWRGFGIPMATDIAFVLALLALLGDRVPAAVKVFLTTLAVVDDLGAVAIIAIFYTSSLQIPYLLLAAALGGLLLLMGQAAYPRDRFEAGALTLAFVAGGVGLWLLLMKSGVHATLSGIVLAAAIPSYDDHPKAPANRWRKRLHRPVYWIVLPLFILANTAVTFTSFKLEPSPLVLGIAGGLLLGKPVGILMGLNTALYIGRSKPAEEVSPQQWTGAAFLGGIGFTMAIFVTSLAFDDPQLIDSAKAAILVLSCLAALIGALLISSIKQKKQKTNQPQKIN